MTTREELIRGIDTLRETIQLSWKDMAEDPMTRAERGALRAAITMMVDDLRERLEQLSAFDA